MQDTQSAPSTDEGVIDTLQALAHHTQHHAKMRHCEVVLVLQVHKGPLICTCSHYSSQALCLLGTATACAPLSTSPKQQTQSTDWLDKLYQTLLWQHQMALLLLTFLKEVNPSKQQALLVMVVVMY